MGNRAATKRTRQDTVMWRTRSPGAGEQARRNAHAVWLHLRNTLKTPPRLQGQRADPGLLARRWGGRPLLGAMGWGGALSGLGGLTGVRVYASTF